MCGFGRGMTSSASSLVARSGHLAISNIILRVVPAKRGAVPLGAGRRLVGAGRREWGIQRRRRAAISLPGPRSADAPGAGIMANTL